MRVSTTTLVICLILALLGLAGQYCIGLIQKQKIAEVVQAASQDGLPPDDFVSAVGLSVASVISRPFDIYYDGQKITLNSNDLAGWVTTTKHWYSGKTELRPNKDVIADFVRTLAPSVNTPPSDAKLAFRDGLLTELVPSRDGINVNLELSAQNIAQAMTDGQSQATLVFDSIAADISLKNAQRLGISELLGKSETSFSGSPFNRIHNIKVGAEKLDSVLLAPGASFSFNQTMGKNTASAGYLPAKVIKNGRYVTEYGGGLCQVSTTLFRAAMYAGLPILERHGHALPVPYYHPQGFDATIYPNVQDLRFQNDTPANILIQSQVNANSITFEIYGTSDQRQVTVIPPRVYVIKANGSFGTILTRNIVDASGASKSEQFFSFYRQPAEAPELKNPLE